MNAGCGLDEEPWRFEARLTELSLRTGRLTVYWRGDPLLFATSRSVNMLCPMDYNVFFDRNPAVCGGQLVIRGTRVPVRTLLASLAEGQEIKAILKAFPSVSSEAMRAVIAFAAASAEEDLPLPPATILA